jgi:type II secretory pathway pseudopilin PulG
MSVLAVILIVLGVLAIVVFIGGLVAVRRRDRARAREFAKHVAAADQALQQARAVDRGWDRAIMEEAARGALRDERPDFAYDSLHLVLVDDRPGTDEDRAHFVALGSDGEARVVLTRTGDHWGAEGVE